MQAPCGLKAGLDIRRQWYLMAVVVPFGAGQFHGLFKACLAMSANHRDVRVVAVGCTHVMFVVRVLGGVSAMRADGGDGE